MDQFKTKIFRQKTFSSLLEEIYNNQKSRQEQVSTLIGELKPLIEDVGDATLIVPLIKEYLDIGVKNDEHLIKMATIIQRIVQDNGNSEGELGISEKEKEELLNQVEKIKQPENA
jgi:hypothetical protein